MFFSFKVTCDLIVAMIFSSVARSAILLTIFLSLSISEAYLSSKSSGTFIMPYCANCARVAFLAISRISASSTFTSYYRTISSFISCHFKSGTILGYSSATDSAVRFSPVTTNQRLNKSSGSSISPTFASNAARASRPNL